MDEMLLQRVGEYWAKLGYAITSAASAAGNGNCKGKSD